MTLNDLVLAAPFNKYLLEIRYGCRKAVIESDTAEISDYECWKALRNADQVYGTKPKHAVIIQKVLLVRPAKAK